MSPFAKIFHDEQQDQILVKLDHHPDNGRPEVRVYYCPAEYGICSSARTWPNNEAGWLGARAAFDRMTEAEARAAAAELQARAAKEAARR